MPILFKKLRLMIFYCIIIIKILSINTSSLEDSEEVSEDLNFTSFDEATALSLESFSNLLEESTKNFNSKIGEIALGFHSRTNRYIYANQNFPENSTIFSLNISHSLSILNPDVSTFCKSLNLSEFSSDENLLENDFDCLIFFLLHIMTAKNSLTDRYTNYINTLPTALDSNFLFLKDRESSIINGSLIGNEWGRIMDLLEDYSIKLSNIDLFKNKFELSDLAYCYQMIDTRNFRIEKNDKFYFFVFPFLDLINFNHNLTNVMVFETIEHNNLIYLNASKNIVKGDELFIDNGQRCNFELFIVYKFTIEENDAPLKAENVFTIYIQDQNFYVNLFADDPMNYLKKALNEILEKLEFDRSENNYERYLDMELKIFEQIKFMIKQYINKQRLENLIKEKNKSKFLINLERALIDEDIILENNLLVVDDLISNNQKAFESYMKTKEVNLTYLENQQYYYSDEYENEEYSNDNDEGSNENINENEIEDEEDYEEDINYDKNHNDQTEIKVDEEKNKQSPKGEL